MSKLIFDFDDGDFAFRIADNMAMDADGNLMMKLSGNTAMDLDTGELHITSDWHSWDEDE